MTGNITVNQQADNSDNPTFIGYADKVSVGEQHIHVAAQTPLDVYAARLRARVEKQEAFFVPLPAEARIQSEFEAYKDYLRQKPNASDTERLENIEQAIAKYDKFVLIGDPGCGKTTTLRHVVLRLLEAYQTVREKGQFARLPFWIDLGYSTNPPDAMDLLNHWWEKQEAISEGITPYHKDGLLWLLLDGLNEMPDSLTGLGSIENRTKSLRDFLEKYPGPVIVTCRTNDYDERLDLGLPVVEVMKLGSEQIAAFGLKRLGIRAPEFQAALEAEPGRKALAANPYALTMMLDLFGDPRYVLPTSREALYDTYIQKRYDDNRKEKRSNSRVNVNLQVLKRAWGRLALRMMYEGCGTTVDEQWAARRAVASIFWMFSLFGKRNLNAALNLGLIVRDEKAAKISFYHQSLYEHLVSPLIDLEEGSIERRLDLIEWLGELRQAALPVLPKLTELYIAETESFEDIRICNYARKTLIEISIGWQSPTSRRFVCSLILETALWAVLDPTFGGIFGTLMIDHLALNPDPELAHIRDHASANAHAFDPEFFRALALDPDDPNTRARSRACDFARIFARDLALDLEELGLEPFDPNKAEAARQELHRELRALAEELSKSGE